MIVNPEVVEVYTSLKTKHTEKRKKTTYRIAKEYQISKCQLKGAHFLHLACQGRWLVPAPRQLRHCFFMLDVAHSQVDVETEFGVVSLILIFL